MILIKTVVCGPCETNTYLVWRDERDDLLLIDPGDGLTRIEAAIAASNRRPTEILLTHGHFDHILSVAPLKEKYGARVRIHPADAQMLESADKCLYGPGSCVMPFVPMQADEVYADGDTFELTACGIAFKGLHTPGHTPGSVALICDEAETVFTGDTIFSQGYGRYDFPGGDLHQLMRSLKTLLALPENLNVLSGHGKKDVMGEIASRWHMK